MWSYIVFGLLVDHVPMAEEHPNITFLVIALMYPLSSIIIAVLSKEVSVPVPTKKFTDGARTWLDIPVKTAIGYAVIYFAVKHGITASQPDE